MAKTNISWTDYTFSGWWGCTQVGPGCLHCFAEALDHRTGGDHWGAGVERRLTSDRNWNEPLRWNRMAAERGAPFKVFASSMCDVFDNEVPQEWRERLWVLIEATPHLRWQILTKRIGNAAGMLPHWWGDGRFPSNVGVMATVVNQQEADRDIPKLLILKAARRVPWVGLSIEPMLGPVNLCNVAGRVVRMPEEHNHFDALRAENGGVDWVICGGESGPHARMMDPDWARSLRDQCQEAGTPFFMKQMTEKKEIPADLLVREWPHALA